jgi:hypothetical protein
MTPLKEHSPGDTVFAKLKGYPWWPARVSQGQRKEKKNFFFLLSLANSHHTKSGRER